MVCSVIVLTTAQAHQESEGTLTVGVVFAGVFVVVESFLHELIEVKSANAEK